MKFVSVCFSIVTTPKRLWLSWKPSSGKEGALLRLPPLETVHAPFNAHSLSISRTTRLLFLILPRRCFCFAFFCKQLLVVVLLAVAHFPSRLSMDLLMAKRVDQYKVAEGGFAFSPGEHAVDLKFFIVEERFPTLPTASLLPL